MAAHGCVLCPYRQGGCCICQQHDHGTFGGSSGPPHAVQPRWPNVNYAQMGIDWAFVGHQARAQEVIKAGLYTKTIDGVLRVFYLDSEGTEVEVVQADHLPSADAPADPDSVWDHLTKT